MKQRVERMAELVRQVVGLEIIKLLPQTQITITEVRVSPSLQHAGIWVAISQNETEIEATLAHLNNERHRFQSELATQLQTKFTPKVSFRLDKGSEHVRDIDDIFGKL